MEKPKRSPPYRAEHIGSLLRPQALKDAWKRYHAGAMTQAAYEEVMAGAIREAVRLQEDVGLAVVTDGEFRRASYWSHFVEAVDGLTVAEASYRFRDAGGHAHAFTAPFAEAKIVRARTISGDEFAFLDTLTERTIKVTMPSPPTMHFWRGRAAFAAGAYDDEEAYFEDLAKIYNAEIADLARRGARYVQIDEVPLAMLCDAGVRERLMAAAVDPADLARRYVGLINECTRRRPPEVTLGLHLCRGNYKGRWLAAGGYDSVAELLFNESAVDAFFLEYDSERAGGFEPLERLPHDKTVVLGLVTTKSPELEDADALARRIDQAARHAPLENLGLSPQCGFSSTVAGNPLSVDDQRRKLELVVRVADAVWGTA